MQQLPKLPFASQIISQMLHGAGIFTYIYPKNDPVL
jgi:hypothetical protein